MFYLFSSLAAGVEWSVPGVSLPSRFGLGRIFWDDVTGMLRSLLVLHPELARAIIAYRSRRLAASEENAKSHGYKGALHPMESADTAQEEAPEWSRVDHCLGHSCRPYVQRRRTR
jgi:trehalose/maltose hydrolase-like predicted phosphorylase